MLRAENISVGYGQREVIHNLSLELRGGDITVLVGPNGSGKSTLLKTLARLLTPSAGTVYLDKQPITAYRSPEVARRMAVLPQNPTPPEGLTVRELVEQGRYPHTGALRMLRRQDHEAIERALAVTRMTDFTDRPLTALSGGERQRAWIALTLAQETHILLLDEPTTFLDIGYQLEVLNLVRDLNHEQDMMIVVVLHDLNQAAIYGHRMVVLQTGSIVADGPPAEVLTEALLAEVFRVRARIIEAPDMPGVPACFPYATLDER